MPLISASQPSYECDRNAQSTDEKTKEVVHSIIKGPAASRGGPAWSYLSLIV